MTTSLREIAGCNINKRNFHVVRDFFGYITGAPRQISLLRQMQLLNGHHVHLNVIRVGIEDFTDEDEQVIDAAVAFARDTYATVDFGIGNVQRRAISTKDAGGFEHIDSDDEAEELTHQFAVVNNANIDVFFVRTYAGPQVGRGPLFGPGPFDKGDKGPMTGIVLALEGGATVTSFELARLVCRYLGLQTRQDPSNLMSTDVPNGGVLTARQGEVMANGSLVFFACDGITVVVLEGGSGFGGASRRSADRRSVADRPIGPRLLSDAINVVDAARGHDRLRAVALGTVASDQRARAIVALADTDDPRRVHDLGAIVLDRHASQDVRSLSATLLGRIDTAAAREELLAALELEEAPLAAVARSLGRIGDPAAFAALARVASSWTGFARKQAHFAMRLISHRWDLDSQHASDDDSGPVPIVAGEMRDVGWGPSNALTTQIALRSLASQPFGIDLDERTAQTILCTGSQLVFLLNRLLGSPPDVQQLRRRKMIAGIVGRLSLDRGLYDASLLVLTAPRADGSSFGISVFAPNGTLVLTGSASPTSSGTSFTCQSVARRGAFAAKIIGSLAAGGFTVTTAQSGRVRQDIGSPEPT